jgi:hypothetical protein
MCFGGAAEIEAVSQHGYEENAGGDGARDPTPHSPLRHPEALPLGELQGCDLTSFPDGFFLSERRETDKLFFVRRAAHPSYTPLFHSGGFVQVGSAINRRRRK